jgi:hypothetical protein
VALSEVTGAKYTDFLVTLYKIPDLVASIKGNFFYRLWYVF